MRRILIGAQLAAALGGIWIAAAYQRDLGVARRRVSTGSVVVQTGCGPIEYADRGKGPPVLVVHGAGGGFDQGLLLGGVLVEHGYRVIAVSRFGYLRTPLPADASAEAQADAHACLLDALGIDRATVFGVSAGGPSTIQFCLRHPERCSAMILLVPLAYPAQSAERLSRPAQLFLERVTGSDFLMWAGARILRTKMLETVLGTPVEDVRLASEDEQRRVYGMLDLMLPMSLRARGLLNERKVVQALRPLPLEGISAPALIASVADDGYGTYAGARYTAEHVGGARFIGYARGGHMLVGHAAEFDSEVLKFLGAPRLGLPTDGRPAREPRFAGSVVGD
jgi:2-hydroxy-6-oxonona-2,4-dienedioate hydrolase